MFARLHRSSHIRYVLVVRPREMQFVIAVLARQLLRLVCLAGSVQTFATLATAALRMLSWLRVQRTSCHVILSLIATSCHVILSLIATSCHVILSLIATSCHVILSLTATSLQPNWKNSHDMLGCRQLLSLVNVQPKYRRYIYRGSAPVSESIGLKSQQHNFQFT